jgi:hypothetical protein
VQLPLARCRSLIRVCEGKRRNQISFGACQRGDLRRVVSLGFFRGHELVRVVGVTSRSDCRADDKWTLLLAGLPTQADAEVDGAADDVSEQFLVEAEPSVDFARYFDVAERVIA